MKSPGSLTCFLVLYAAMYAAFGVASPFWPRLFETRGLTPEQLGLLLGLGTAMRLLAGPVANRIADLLAALRGVLTICLLLSTASALAFLGAHEFQVLLVVHIAQSVALAPVTTLADALAVRASMRPPRFEYGLVRGAASAAFVIGTLAAGHVLVHAELESIIWMHAVLLAGALLAVAMVPKDTPVRFGDQNNQSVFGGIRELFRLTVFRRVIIVAALIYGSHAMHDAFSVIRWTAAGVGPWETSVLWSEAVTAEVVMFVLVGPALLFRVGPGGAAALAAAAGIVRWVVESQTAAIWTLSFVQPLHGLTFALMHLACIRIIAISVPGHLAATAQAIYALGPGFATAFLVWASGGLYGTFGARGFLVMAALCLLALPLALSLRGFADRA